jgi:hypothetical protein
MGLGRFGNRMPVLPIPQPVTPCAVDASRSRPALTRWQDVLGLAQSLLRVLTDEKLRARLALAARHTALRYTPEAIADR